MALTTGDAICDAIIAKSKARGVEYSDDFVRLLAKPIAEIDDFQRLLNQPFRQRGGSVLELAETLDDLELSSVKKRIEYGQRAAEIEFRAARLAKLGQGLKVFGRAAAGGFVLGELAINVTSLLGQLWWFTHPTPIDPDKHRKAGCGGSLKQVGGIWNQDFVDALFDLLDAYEVEVKQTWESLRNRVIIPGIVRQFWIDMQADYYQAVFSFTGKIRNSVQPSKFGPGNVRRTRNGVHPR